MFRSPDDGNPNAKGAHTAVLLRPLPMCLADCACAPAVQLESLEVGAE